MASLEWQRALIIKSDFPKLNGRKVWVAARAPMDTGPSLSLDDGLPCKLNKLGYISNVANELDPSYTLAFAWDSVELLPERAVGLGEIFYNDWIEETDEESGA